MHQNHTQTHQAHCQSVWGCPQWTRHHSCVGVRGPAVCSPSAGTTAPPLWSLGEWGPAGEVSGPTHPGWHALLPPLAEATKGPTRCKNKTQKPAKLSITYHFRLQTLGVCLLRLPSRLSFPFLKQLMCIEFHALLRSKSETCRYKYPFGWACLTAYYRSNRQLRHELVCMSYW